MAAEAPELFIPSSDLPPFFITSPSSVHKSENAVGEVESLMTMENLPASPAVDAEGNPVARNRGYHIGKLVRAAKEMMAQDRATLAAKGFIAYAKTTSTIAATVCNAINLFGCTVGYMIHDNSSTRLKNNLHMRHVFIEMTLAFLPFTVLTAGLASTLKAKRSYSTMINIVAVMLHMEAMYMAAMCSLFCYYLIDKSKKEVVLLSTIGAAAVLIAIPSFMYGRPGLWGGWRRRVQQ